MKLHLRPLAAADGDRLYRWRRDPEVARRMYTAGPESLEAHRRWLAAALANAGRRDWIAELDGAPVGLASVTELGGAGGEASWAFYLGEAAARGRGAGAAIEYLVLRWVFEARRLRRLRCEVLLENEAVWRAHERFGFTREAVLRGHVVKDGQALDVVRLVMGAEAWPAARAAAEGRLLARGVTPEQLSVG